MRWLFHLVYGLSVAAGAGMLFFLFRHRPPAEMEWPVLLVFFLFLLGADTKLSEAQLGGGKVMSSKSIVLAVLALFGPAAAAGLEALSALVRGLLLRRSEPRKTVFNAAMLAVSAGGAGLVYGLLPWHDRFDSPGFLVPLLGALLTHTILNRLLVAAILSLDATVPLRQIYRQKLTLPKTRNLSDVPFAAIFILLFQQAGVWTLGLALFPVLVLFQYDRLIQGMKEAHINSIAALTTALEADEPYTHGHSYRVSRYAVKIGRQLELSDQDLEILEYGGLLHDIGKIAITNDIICKPGRLSEEEFATVRTHPTIGADIVEQIKFLRDTSDLVRHHHERPDGKGYPHGLQDGEISLGCHILNVCDAFDAMTSDRPYRKAMTVEQAIEELVRFRGTQFDDRVVGAVLELYHQGEFDYLGALEPLPLEAVHA